MLRRRTLVAILVRHPIVETETKRHNLSTHPISENHRFDHRLQLDVLVRTNELPFHVCSGRKLSLSASPPAASYGSEPGMDWSGELALVGARKLCINLCSVTWNGAPKNS